MSSGSIFDPANYIRHLEQQTRNQAETIKALNETIEELRQTVANLRETLDELNRKLFGKSSEQIRPQPPEDGTAEDTAGSGGQEIHVKEHIRERQSKSPRDDLYKSIPVRRIECPASEDQLNCPDCDALMEHLGWQFVREEIRITMAKVERIQYFRETLVCPECREEDDTTIVHSDVPAPLLKHSLASPSIVANVMYDKSGLYLPFYRQEMDWKQKGVPMPRETLAYWYNKCALDYLSVIYDALHAHLLNREVIHADEVPGQVLHEKDRTPEQKSYFWIYLTGTDGLPGIVLFDYQPGRGGKYPAAFLKGFSGYLHCDGYSAYGMLTGIILICCLAHCRRKFFEAVPKEKRKRLKLLDVRSEQAVPEPAGDIAGREDLLPAEKGVLFCNRLFFMERQYKDLPPEERKVKRNETEPAVWEEFWTWLDTLDPVGGSKLEKAVKYARNHKESLMNYLLDGRCEISNNAAERKAKVYATSRKNFLFHDTEDGAKATAIVLSIIETAKANGLNPFQYLYTLLLFVPGHKDSPAGIEQLMPWSDFIQERCSGQADTETYTPENPGKLPV